jgi:hypothetical protein
MKRICIAVSLFFLLILSTIAFALPNSGIVYGTDVAYSNLDVNKNGVDIDLINSSDATVRISVKLHFLNAENERIAETFFALREMEPGASSHFKSNFLKGNWKKAVKAPRIRWELFTYTEQR